MKIQKLLHSCLLVEENGKYILIDPGSWSFNTTATQVSSIPKVEAIFITHSHADHCSPETIKQFVERDQAPVYCNADVANTLANAGIKSESMAVPQTVDIGGFTVTSVEAAHGSLPWSTAVNNGFLVNNRLFTPGDSHEFTLPSAPEILALPISAPWGTATRATELALALKPKHVIPVHDMIVADNFRLRLIQIVGDYLEKSGIEYHSLQPNEILEI